MRPLSPPLSSEELNSCPTVWLTVLPHSMGDTSWYDKARNAGPSFTEGRPPEHLEQTRAQDCLTFGYMAPKCSLLNFQASVFCNIIVRHGWGFRLYASLCNLWLCLRIFSLIPVNVFLLRSWVELSQACTKETSGIPLLRRSGTTR